MVKLSMNRMGFGRNVVLLIIYRRLPVSLIPDGSINFLHTAPSSIKKKKAYDCVNRDILWGRLSSIGVYGKLFGAIRSLYSSVSSCVRINHVVSCVSVKAEA